MIPNNVIRVVPLTDDDLAVIQLTVGSRMLQIYQESNTGFIDKDTASAEILRLSEVMEKCSKYGAERQRKPS